MAELAYTLTATEDERLLQAEAVVRDYCGWHIAPSYTDTVTMRGTTSNRLFLPSLYLTAVDSVTVDGVLLVEGTDYYANREGFLTRMGGGWWTGEEIVVVFTHGYPDPPASVTAAVQALARSATANPSAVSRDTAGPFTVAYANSEEMLTGMVGLSAYRIVSVA